MDVVIVVLATGLGTSRVFVNVRLAGHRGLQREEERRESNYRLWRGKPGEAGERKLSEEKSRGTGYPSYNPGVPVFWVRSNFRAGDPVAQQVRVLHRDSGSFN